VKKEKQQQQEQPLLHFPLLFLLNEQKLLQLLVAATFVCLFLCFSRQEALQGRRGGGGGGGGGGAGGRGEGEEENLDGDLSFDSGNFLFSKCRHKR